ncbi:MAG: sigma-70 family RNA polymerase sigma factor [Vicinamibacteria bacterium]
MSAATVEPSSPAGREGRFEGMVRQYGRLISAVVARVGGQATSLFREDIEQQVLIELWRQVDREQKIDHPSSYLYKAAVRETVRVLRRELSREVVRDGVQEAGGGESPYQSLAGKEQAAALEECVASLAPERQRAVRAHLSGFDVQEIMAMQGWPYQKARNLIARGMAELREALLQRGIRG